MATVYNDKGESFKVAHPIDVKEWLKAGYTTTPKPKTVKKPRTKKES